MTERKEKLEEKLGHDFAQPELLADALTHPSLGGEKSKKKKPSSAYERLEFSRRPRCLALPSPRGFTSFIQAPTKASLPSGTPALVNRDALKKVAEEIGLENALRLAHGETAGMGRKNLTVLSDAMEAVIARCIWTAACACGNLYTALLDASIHEAHAPGRSQNRFAGMGAGRGLAVCLNIRW
jgi:hypothetical protein